MTLTLASTLVFFGILQSVLMIVLIFTTKKWKQVQNSILIALLLVLGVSLLPPFIGNSGLVDRSGALRFLPLYLSVFVFPLLFLYLKSIFNINFEWNKKLLGHFILPVVFWLYAIFIWGTTLNVPVSEKGVVAARWYYFEMATIENTILVMMVGYYTILSHKLLRTARSNGLSKNQLRFVKWFQFLLTLLFIGAVLDVLSKIVGHWYGYWKGSPLDVWLGISFALLVKIYYAITVYIIAVVGYTSYTNFITPKAWDTTMGDAIKKYLPQLIHLMEKEKLFLDATLTLASLAAKLDTTSGTLSAVLNNGQKESFNDFVNRYRVEEVKEKLKRKDSAQFTLLALAEDSGFKSKTTFYRAFQKFTTQTPKSYLENLDSKN